MSYKTILLYFPIIILLQITSINFFPANYEYVYSEGSKFFKELDLQYIHFFFENQANTYFFSIIISLINKFTFSLFDELLISRIISLSSYIFLGIGIFNFFKFLQIDKSLILLSILFIFLNPIIWTLSFRGFPDLISASLGFWACSIILTKFENTFYRRLGILLLSISITLKPISCIFLIIIFFLLKNKRKKIFRKQIFVDIVCLLIVPCIYFLTVKSFFGFYLMSDKFYSKHKLEFEFNIFLKNLVSYLCFLSIFSFPIFFNFKTKLNVRIIIFYILILLLGFIEFNFLSSNLGEMNFGFFNDFINTHLVIFFSYTLLFIFLLKLFEIIIDKEKNENNLKIIATIVIFLFIMSLSRPVQRYLIFILPIILLLLIKNSELKKIKILMMSSIFIFMIINLTIYFHNYENSKFHKKIYNNIKNSEMLDEIKIERLKHSLGFIEIKNFNVKKKYILTDKSQDYIKKFEKNFLGIKKIFYIENNKF